MKLFCVVFLVVQCEQPSIEYVPPGGPCPVAEQPTIMNLWIDQDCPEEVMEATMDAVDTLNEFGQDFGCVELAEIIGTVKITDERPKPGTLVCQNEKNNLNCRGRTYSKWKYIDLNVWQWSLEDTDRNEGTILHELTHLVLDVHGHIPNRNSLMNAKSIGVARYTQADVDFICEVGNLTCR
jgi:hypothetical protein